MTEIVAVKLGVADDDAARIDQCDTTRKCGSRCVGERVSRGAWLPIACDEPRFALELAPRFLREAVAKTTSGDCDDAGHEENDQHQQPSEESLGERHALRD